MLVDELNLLTGILKTSDQDTTFSRLLVDLSLHDLTKIIYILWFQDNFGGEQAHDYWAI